MKNNIVLPTLSQLLSQVAVHLSGVTGTNRDNPKKCQIKAQNDYDAVWQWLNEYIDRPTTYRSYQKEAERFLLWSIYQCNKPLSSLDRHDLDAYLLFLDNPQPKKLWCAQAGGRGNRRGHKNWRPFVSGLSPITKTTTVTIINSLLTYLVDAHYLAFNPLSLMKIRKRRKQHLAEQQFNVQERILNLDEWHTMLDTLDEMPHKTPRDRDEKARLKLLVSILYFLGLRINELATHTWSAFRKVGDNWWFYVVGKGGKPAKIPVNDELLAAVADYRRQLCFANLLPQTNEDRPIIVSWTTGKALTARHMNKLLKKLAIKTAEKFDGQPDKQVKLEKFSAHWLRHLSASMQDKAGIKFKHIRANQRHENDNTTRLYVHALDDERHEEMQKLTLRFNDQFRKNY